MNAFTSAHHRDGSNDNSGPRPGNIERRVTQWPVVASSTRDTAGRGGGLTNDGVFANMSAKPGVGGDEEADEKPPVSFSHPKLMEICQRFMR